MGKERTVLIKAGINNVKEDQGQVVYPERFIVHEGWSAEKQINDISLIRLKTPIRYQTNNQNQYTVNAICLTEPYVEPKGHCQLAGWGQLGEDKSSPDWLQKITMPLWSRGECARNYREYMQIRNTHICAGGKGGEDSCMVCIFMSL